MPAPLARDHRSHGQIAVVQAARGPVPLAARVGHLSHQIQLLRHLDAGTRQHRAHLFRSRVGTHVLHGVVHTGAVGGEKAVVAAVAREGLVEAARSSSLPVDSRMRAVQ